MHNDLIIRKDDQWFILDDETGVREELFFCLLAHEGLELEDGADVEQMLFRLERLGWHVESRRSFAA